MSQGARLPSTLASLGVLSWPGFALTSPVERCGSGLRRGTFSPLALSVGRLLVQWIWAKGGMSLCFLTAQSVEKLTVHTKNQTTHNKGGQDKPSSMMNALMDSMKCNLDIW